MVSSTKARAMLTQQLVLALKPSELVAANLGKNWVVKRFWPMRLPPHLVCAPPREQSVPTARAPPRTTDGKDSSLGPGHSLAPAKTSRSPYSRRPRPPPHTAMDVPSLSPLAQLPRRPDPHLPPIRAQRPCQSRFHPRELQPIPLIKRNLCRNA